VKTESADGVFKATHVATLKIPKKYEKKLIDSGDDDFVALAKMNGKDIAIMFHPGPLVGRNMEEVAIFEPFEGMLDKKYIKNIRSLHGYS